MRLNRYEERRLGGKNMDWYQIGAAGLLAGLAGRVGKLVERRTSRTVGAVTLVVLLVAFQSFNQSFLGPWMKQLRVERAFLAMPAYQAMRDVDAPTYESVVRTVKVGIQNG